MLCDATVLIMLAFNTHLQIIDRIFNFSYRDDIFITGDLCDEIYRRVHLGWIRLTEKKKRIVKYIL